MPRRSTYLLRWSAQQQRYELLADRHLIESFRPEDTPAWLHWLEAQRSFAFEGRRGRLSVVQESRPRGGGYWYGYRAFGRRTSKRYLGQTGHVTLAQLEEVAGSLVQAREGTNDRPDQSALLLPKLLAPLLPASLVARPRLLQQLNASQDRKLTLLLAPAGFGKTMLLSQWLDQRQKAKGKRQNETHDDRFLPFHFSLLPSHVAWVSLDAGDNDPIRFWRYMIVAYQRLQPQIGQVALAQLGAAVQPSFATPPLEKILTLLLNDLTQLLPDAVLVLDDYHSIVEPRIHETLAFFIDHLPGTLRVVLAARGAPPLPLLRWRARGELTEILPADLRFSAEETAVFLRQALAISLPEGARKQLDRALEGWPAGLRLLALSLQGQTSQPAIEQMIGALGEESDAALPHQPILEYFVAEIFNGQPEALQRFLLHTSVLSRMTSALCDAITGSQDSAALLSQIERAGLFLEATNGTRRWYRYHALFAEALRKEADRQLGSAALWALSLRASRWYEQHGLSAEAIETALLGQDLERAALLIEQADRDGRLDEPQTLNRWLEQLPEAVLHARPGLCLLAAIALRFAGQISGPLPESLSERIEAKLLWAATGWRGQDQSRLGAIDSFRALSDLALGASTQAIEHAERGLSTLPQEHPDWRIQVGRGVCLFIVGLGKMHEGHIGAALQLFLEAHTCSLAGSDRHFTRGMLLLLGWCCSLQGELHQAAEYYRQVLPSASEQGDREHMANALIGLASIAYEWNELAAAEQYALDMLEVVRDEGPAQRDRANFQLALVHHARGHTTAAQQQIAEIIARLHAIASTEAMMLLPYVLDWQAHIQLAVGDREGAQRNLEMLAHYEQALAFEHRLGLDLLRTRILLAQGRADRARMRLEELLPIAQSRQLMASILEIQLLLVQAHVASEQEQLAHSWLLRALSEGRKGGYLRIFLAEGEPLARRLRALAPSIQEPALRTYLRSILRAFAATEETPSLATDSLMEPLSPQEQRVLRLLAAGRSNPQIATELIISVNTVKDHVKRLYRKLGVNNRAQAGQAAQQLQLV